MKSRRVNLLCCQKIYKEFYFYHDLARKKTYDPRIIKGHRFSLLRDYSFGYVTVNRQLLAFDLKVAMRRYCLTGVNAIKTPCTCAENMF